MQVTNNLQIPVEVLLQNKPITSKTCRQAVRLADEESKDQRPNLLNGPEKIDFSLVVKPE